MGQEAISSYEQEMTEHLQGIADRVKLWPEEQQRYYPQQFHTPVINADNKMITGGVIGWTIWIYQIIKRAANRTNDIS